MNENGWKEWKEHVLAELRRISTAQETLTDKFNTFQVEYAADKGRNDGTKKTWSTVAGFLGGLLSGALTRILFPHQ